MMVFTQLTEAEFKAHAYDLAHMNFTQTVEMANLRKDRGYTINYVGVKSKGVVIASALVAKIKMAFGYYFEITGGFFGDYHDDALVQTFGTGLKRWMRANKGLYLTMYCDEVYQLRDFMGAPIGASNDKGLSELKAAGFVHRGFEKGSQNAQPGWVFIKDLALIDDAQALLKSYEKDAIYAIKKTAQFGITIRELTKDELPKFKALTAHTAGRRQFTDKPLDYYECVFDHFGDRAKFVVAQINFGHYVAQLENRRTELNKKLAKIDLQLEKTPNSSKMLNQKREFEAQRRTYDARLVEAKDHLVASGEDDVILAGGLFIINAREMVYLFSGTYDVYKNFYAPFLIQHEMMSRALQMGIKRYNFYGISGHFDGTDGVLKFKQNFSGFVEQKLGVFDLVAHPAKYQLYQWLKRLKKG